MTELRQSRPAQNERRQKDLRLHRHPVLESGPYPGDQRPRTASIIPPQPHKQRRLLPSFCLAGAWGIRCPASSFRAKREIFVIRSQGLTLSPHVLRLSAFLIHTRGKAATRALSPSYLSTHSSFLPPSFGRRFPEGAEVGSRSAIFTRGEANPASLRSSAPSRGRGENDS